MPLMAGELTAQLGHCSELELESLNDPVIEFLNDCRLHNGGSTLFHSTGFLLWLRVEAAEILLQQEVPWVDPYQGGAILISLLSACGAFCSTLIM